MTNKVFVYFNLHKHVFSLQSRNKEDYGLVSGHADHVILKNVKFVVREGGRQRVLKEKKKNVHAGVVGEVVQGLPEGNVSVLEFPVTYNPYQTTSFVKRADREAVYEADYAILRLGVDGKPLTSAYEVHFNG
jgi:hypothetical protein